MVEVSINQENFIVPAPGSLAEVLPLLQISQADGIAIAVNNTVIPRPEWDKYMLRQHDEVFVIRASAGG